MCSSDLDESSRQAVVYVTDALNAIRKAKTDSKVSVGTPVQQVIYQGPNEIIVCLSQVERDIKAASRADVLVLRAGEPAVEITLKPAQA